MLFRLSALALGCAATASAGSLRALKFADMGDDASTGMVCGSHPMDGSFDVFTCSSLDLDGGISCGGDWLDDATTAANIDAGNAFFSIETNHAYNLYEVYYEESVSALGSSTYVGYTITDSAGLFDGNLKSGAPTSWADYSSASDVSVSAVLGSESVEGNYVFYSRGPSAEDDGSGGVCYNTVVDPCDSDLSNAFANPAVTERDMVQFVTCSA